jgi:hypothetical protein
MEALLELHLLASYIVGKPCLVSTQEWGIPGKPAIHPQVPLPTLR